MVFRTRSLVLVAAALLALTAAEVRAQGRGGHCARGPGGGNTPVGQSNMTGRPQMTMQRPAMIGQPQQQYAVMAALQQNQMMIQAQQQMQYLQNQQMLLTWQRQLQAKERAKQNQLNGGGQ